jgi:hypothetical protein
MSAGNGGNNAGAGSADYDEYPNSGSPSNENRILVSQILELRRRLDEDHQSYKRKLQHYQESQQKQAQLVSKLQQKVLQYKTKCNELELSIESKNVENERMRVNYFVIAFKFHFA